MKIRMASASIVTPGIGWSESRDQVRRYVTAFLSSHVARLLILSGVPRGSGSNGRICTLITLILYKIASDVYFVYFFIVPWFSQAQIQIILALTGRYKYIV